MKKTIAIVLCILCFVGTIGFYLMKLKEGLSPAEIKSEDTNGHKNIRKEYASLEEAVRHSQKVNILMLGVEEEPRSDTIILISLDSKKKSNPHDIYTKGYLLS